MERSSSPSVGARASFTALYAFIWVTTILRLYRHSDGEVFLHWSGLTDSSIALIMPLAIVQLFWQAKGEARTSNDE